MRTESNNPRPLNQKDAGLREEQWVAESRLSRRKWLLKTAGIAGAAWALSGRSVRSESDMPAVAAGSNRKRRLRLAHLTDVHLQPELRAEKGMAKCLHHVQSLEDAPELILFGGDCVMDVVSVKDERSRTLRDLWLRTLKNECSLPNYSTIGNHDVWGWNKTRSGTSGNEALWGKAWAHDLLGLEQSYYSFDVAGWHFIVLDSVSPVEGQRPYVGCLDEAQFDWLSKDLATVPQHSPVLVLSHIPIMTATAFYDHRKQGADWVVPGYIMHTDSQRIRKLFVKHPNVKLCLSGHTHQIDQVVLQGVGYCCNGAVCGYWWRNQPQPADRFDCPNGYGIVDLYDDGSWENHYTAYGWQA